MSLPLFARRSLAAFTAVCTFAHGRSESISLIPSADTSIFQASPGNNLGANGSGVIGTTVKGASGRMLLRFDLASKIPTNAIIKSVALSLHSTKIRNSSPVPVAVHRMLLGWTEGVGGKGSKTGTGAPATGGEPTWMHRIHPTASWSTPGASDPADFTGVPSGTSTVAGIGSFTFSSNPTLVSDVSGWIQNPTSNLGWILLAQGSPANGSAKRIGTRENPGLEPTLLVEFDVPKPAEPLAVTILPSADTYLFEHKPENNFGTAPQLRVGTTAQSKRARALLRFDVHSTLPTNAVITNASLSISITKAPGSGGAPSNLQLHPMLRPWNEGSQTDGLAAANEATWSVQENLSSSWGAPGGLPLFDFSPVVLSSIPVNLPGTYVFPSSPEFTQQLQHWLSFPNDNFGCLLASDQESTPQSARELAARENETGKPELRLGYFLLAPEETPDLLGIISSDTKLIVQVRIASQIQAVLERSASLENPSWSAVASAIGTPEASNLNLEILAPSEPSFYRLRASGRTQP